ncbi:MAG: hypothetical protein IPK27_17575 [Rhodanobacteraceae bacterium]|nr:hypothetical protein [Rhodanobacteraceae bacterium]
MSDDNNSVLLLLALGPAAATGLYWGLYRHYRNTDKSHAFEHETAVEAKPIVSADRKIDEIKGTQATSIPGDNVGAYRARVRRVDFDSG